MLTLCTGCDNLLDLRGNEVLRVGLQTISPKISNLATTEAGTHYFLLPFCPPRHNLPIFSGQLLGTITFPLNYIRHGNGGKGIVFRNEDDGLM